jgi:signal peptidase I
MIRNLIYDCRELYMNIRKFVILNRVLFIIFLFFILSIFLFDVHLVSGSSMTPLLEQGDWVLSSPWVYGIPRFLTSGYIFRWKEVGHNDILVYNSPVEARVSIKRCVAVPGDRIDFTEGLFFVNGEALPPAPHLPLGAFQDGFLGPEVYFLTGDNYRHSVDSRTYGPIRSDLIIGKVLFTSGGYGRKQ